MKNTPSYRIAIIDDYAPFIAAFRKLLTSMGYDVVEAGCPKDWDYILQLKGSSAPDLFVIDLQMPHDGRYAEKIGGDFDYTGFLLARELRNKFRKRPIIFYSSFPRFELKKIARKHANNIGNSICLDKRSCSVEDAADQINEYFKFKKFKISILERLKRAIIARPTFAGFGLDLTKL